MAADGKTPPTHPQGGGREHYVYMKYLCLHTQ